jgi:hypothetical protein
MQDERIQTLQQILNIQHQWQLRQCPSSKSNTVAHTMNPQNKRSMMFLELDNNTNKHSSENKTLSTPNEINFGATLGRDKPLYSSNVCIKVDNMLAEVAPSNNLVTNSCIACLLKFSTMYVVNKTHDSLFKEVTSS